MHTATIGRVDVERSWRIGTAEGAIVADRGP